LAVLTIAISRKDLLLTIAPEEVGVLIVRVDLVQEPVILVEPLLVGRARASEIAEAPFTEDAGPVTRPPEQLRGGPILGIGAQRDRPRVGANRRVAGVQTAAPA